MARVLKPKGRGRDFVVERYGEVDLQFDGVHLACVDTPDDPLFGDSDQAGTILDLYRATGGKYVVAKGGWRLTPQAFIAESPQDVLLKLLDKDDLLHDLEKLLLTEAGKRDREIAAIARLRITPDAIRRLAEGVPSASLLANSSEFEEHLTRIERGLDADPEQAIGSAKELMEAVAAQILRRHEKTPDRAWDFPKLMKEALGALRLTPGQIPSATRGANASRDVLRGLTQVVHGMAELRNVFGTGHAKPHHFRAEPRHARLAVGAAATLCTFALATLDARATEEIVDGGSRKSK